MVLLCYWLFPILLAVTVHIQKLQNEFYKYKYFNSALLALVGSIFLVITNIARVDYHDFTFLKDYRFYLSQIISVIFMIVQFKSRKLNEHNVTICYFVNFLSLAIVPFVSIGLMHLFSFKNTIEVQYESKSDIYLLSLSLFVLAIFFYIDKLKSKSINGFKVLLMAFVFGAVSGVFGSKMMQEYNPVNYMIVATLFNLLVFIILSLIKEKREKHHDENSRKLNKNDLRNYLFMVMGYCVTIYINTIIISNIPAEQYSIIRNVGIIIVNYAYTYHYENINLVNWKDSFVLCLMITALVYFTF
jgi:hypothetical protein